MRLIWKVCAVLPWFGLIALTAPPRAEAGSATWSSNPISNDWNRAANWTPNTVPNSLTDVATFGTSVVTDVSLTRTPYNNIDSMVFNAGADSYSITVSNISAGQIFNGAGIVNNSGVTQHFIATQGGLFFFLNSASCGDNTDFAVLGGNMLFDEAATAGTAHFTVSDASGVGGAVSFFSQEGSTESATFDIGLNGGVTVNFSDAPNTTFNIVGGDLNMEGGVFLGTSVIDCSEGGTMELQLFYNGQGSTGTPQITVHGAASRSARRCAVYFLGAQMGRSTVTLEGGTSAQAAGAIGYMYQQATLQSANVTLTGGTSGGEGAVLKFTDRSDGGLARMTVMGNAVLDLSVHSRINPVKFGSLAGDGSVLIGATPLSIGSNNLSTIFSGIIADGTGRIAGPLTKIGTGTLALNGSNTYTGPTTVSSGALGGSGCVLGPLTVGADGSSGATLAPAAGTPDAVTFTIRRRVTFGSTSTFSCLLSGVGTAPVNDRIAAGGVTIAGGSQFVLSSQVRGRLRQGSVFTVINNTAATAINGTFTNLADGAIICENGVNLQANYTGGDGNDLTLTVVP